MIPIVSLTALLMLAPAPPAFDTTVAVNKGMRLSVEAASGSVSVDTWSRDAVRISADAERDGIDVHSGAGTVHVETEADRSEDVHYRITVPGWMDIHVETRGSDVDVRGAGGEVGLETIRGNITLDGGRGFVSVGSVEGELTVQGAQGRVKAETVNGSVTVRNVKGEVTASTVNGGINLANVNATSVRAEAVNGPVVFRGPLLAGGYYHLSSHNSGVRLLLPGPPDAAFSITTFNGHVDSDFPLQLNSMSDGKHMSFTAGHGSARVELESFNGTVVIARESHTEGGK